MKKELKLTINGTTYPCRLTMGALVRFAEVTGHEYSEFTGSLSDACAFIWACLKSASEREKIPFPYDFMEFCDNVDPEDITGAMTAFSQSNPPSEDERDEAEKKS